MKRIKPWLSQFDWRALVGSSLFALFYFGVIIPAVTLTSTVSQPREEADYIYESSTQKNASGESFWYRTTRDPVALYTLWLSVFTAGLTVSTIGLWWVTRNALLHAQQDAARQTDQMQASIAAAQKSVTVAVQSLRPWVSIEEIKATDVPEMVNGILRLPLLITLKNSGKSPALHAQVVMQLVDVSEVVWEVQANMLRNEWANRDNGEAIFPEANPERRITVYASERVNTVFEKVGEIWPWIVGVVVYRGQGTSEPFSHTGFMFNVNVRRPGTIQPAILRGERIDLSQVEIRTAGTGNVAT